MGQSLSQLYVHLTFGTKERYAFISSDWERKLLAFITGIIKNHDSSCIISNCVEDHVHILFSMSKNYALSKIIENIKKESSKWVKDNIPSCSKFSWQTGYGGFSVSSSKLEVVKRYIENQKEHHKKLSYQEEVKMFFKEYNLEYNPEYYWR
ncbi:IS200/IS605 family transposase [Labilibacter sediminis]|nr:IS200/IS605 family transposase [Labilibacter sediminis]